MPTKTTATRQRAKVVDVDPKPPLLDPDLLRAMVLNWRHECGLEIRRRRIARDWSQEQFASLVGVTPMSISRIEMGNQSPPDSVRLAIACSLNCEINDIWPPLNTRFAMAICRPVVAA